MNNVLKNNVVDVILFIVEFVGNMEQNGMDGLLMGMIITMDVLYVMTVTISSGITKF